MVFSYPCHPSSSLTTTLGVLYIVYPEKFQVTVRRQNTAGLDATSSLKTRTRTGLGELRNQQLGYKDTEVSYAAWIQMWTEASQIAAWLNGSSVFTASSSALNRSGVRSVPRIPIRGWRSQSAPYRQYQRPHLPSVQWCLVHRVQNKDGCHKLTPACMVPEGKKQGRLLTYPLEHPRRVFHGSF